VRRSALADVVELIVAGFARDAFGTTAGLLAPGFLAPDGDGRFAAATSGTQDGETKVRGVRESGPANDDRSGGAPKAAQATTFGDLESSSDNLLSLLLLAAAIFSAVFLMHGVARALR
jgi:hypothetical protein